MREDLIELAKQQAAEIARAGHNGWGNTMLALAAALEAAREDAGRYRWLRAQNVIAVTSHDQSIDYQRDDLDAEIDQARGKGANDEA